MLTERKMFSSSFASSAASGDETAWTSSIADAYSATAAAVEASHHLGDVLRGPVLAAGVDSFGRECEMEVLAGLETAPRLERGLHLLTGGPRVRRRLEDDEVSRTQPLRDRLRRRYEDRQVRLALP
jgi:hypothetical protein